QAWVRLSGRFFSKTWRSTGVWKAAAWAITFLAVVIGWVFFRAADLDAAMAMLRAMAGLNGIALPNAIIARLGPVSQDFLIQLGVERSMSGGGQFMMTFIWVTALLGLSLLAPNTYQIMRAFEPASDRFEANLKQAIEPLGEATTWLRWRPGVGAAVPVAVASVLGFLALSSVSEFLYFQF
ncbi:MAG: MBOAT family protein, partial [Geminicoccaceae bacterium]